MPSDDAAQGNPALIFSAECCATAARVPRFDRNQFQIWAAAEDEAGAATRAQIERAAASVPPAKRKSVLGQLLAKKPRGDQVRADLGSLFLGKTLADLGWEVEFEPTIDGATPDLRVTKDGETFVVEVRRVAGLFATSLAEQRVRGVLDDIQTCTPVCFRLIHVDAQASLKGFQRHMRALLADGAEIRSGHRYDEEGVAIIFDVPQRFSEPTSAVFSMPVQMRAGGQHDEVRAHINEKLAKYKYPIIVALDFIDPMTPCFRTTEEVILGRQGFAVGFDPNTGRGSGLVEQTRLPDGLARVAAHDGVRAEERLLAVLPFTLRWEADGYHLRARVVANPRTQTPSLLAPFAPIPRLVVTEPREGRVVMHYLDGTGERIEGSPEWTHSP